MIATLTPSAKIAFVCPGTACTQQEAQHSAHYLQSHYQLDVTYQEDVYQLLPAKKRAEIFLDYLFDSSITLIWQLRGGEGAADIIPYIHQHKIKIASQPPKQLIGFSDFTPILVYFSQHYNWQTIHGISARQLYLRNINQVTEDMTMAWLMGKCSHITVKNLCPYNEEASASHSIYGNVIGGNLSLLSISPKDDWEMNCANKIVLIEEVNEMPYKIARMLKYLQRIDLFKNALAIILAGFTYDAEKFTNHAILDQSVAKILSEFGSTCQCPVLFTKQISHDKNNLPITFSMPAMLTLGKQPFLKITRQ